MVEELRENKLNPQTPQCKVWFASECRSKMAMLGLCLEDDVAERNFLMVQICSSVPGPALASILLQAQQH